MRRRYNVETKELQDKLDHAGKVISTLQGNQDERPVQNGKNAQMCKWCLTTCACTWCVKGRLKCFLSCGMKSPWPALKTEMLVYQSTANLGLELCFVESLTS